MLALNFQTSENEIRISNKIKLISRKTLYPSKLVKNCVKIEENRNWKDHSHDTATKFNKENALLCKIKNYVNFQTLFTLYSLTHILP